MTPEDLRKNLCIIVLCNDEECLNRNLLQSSLIKDWGVPVHIEKGAKSASYGYNRGLDATRSEYVLFAHQDVYFPPNWGAELVKAISDLNKMDPKWGLVAPFGISLEGEHRGDVWSTSLGRRVGRKVTAPLPVQSYDELAFVMRRSSGLRFDEGLPLFHLYGTDIVQTAEKQGSKAYVADLPVVHNDKFHDHLRSDFVQGYNYIRKKWRHSLPIKTPVTLVTWHGLNLKLYRLRAYWNIEYRRSYSGDATVSPIKFSRECGWE